MTGERERMEPDEIRNIIEMLEVEDEVLIESSRTHRRLRVDAVSEDRLKLVGLQGGRKWLYPSPEGNTKSGNDPVQLQDDSHGANHRRVWYIERIDPDSDS